MPKLGGRRRAGGTEAASFLGCPSTAEEAEALQDTVAAMAKYEAMDLELRNSPLVQAIRSRQPRRSYVHALIARWFIALTCGLAIGMLTFFFNWAIRGLWLALYRVTEHVISSHGDRFGPAYGVYIAFTLVFALLATLPVTAVGRGGLADGGGISELKAHFNGVFTKGMLTFWPAAAQTVSGVFVNAANLVGVGEAPLVHVAAAIASALCRPLRDPTSRPMMGGRLRQWLRLRRLGTLFDNEKDHRDFVSQGASAGFTMAFITPIAGTLFPAEEGGLAFAPSRLFMALISSCMAMLALMVSVTIYKQPGSFWEYRMFDLIYPASTNIVGRLYYVYIWELPIFIVMGALCGVAGGLFVACNIRLRHFRKRVMSWDTPRQWLRCVEVLLIAAVTASVWIGICYASPCRATPPTQYQPLLRTQLIPNSLLQLGSRVTSSYPQLWCPNGQYAVWGTIFWQPLQSLTRILIFLTPAGAQPEVLPAGLDAPYLDNKALAMFMFIQFVLVTWTYGSAIAFGVFTPALTIGAALGQLTGHLVKHIAAGLNGDITISPPTYAVIGAASMLSGFARYRLTAVVLTAELSGAISLAPVIALGCATATAVGNLFGQGIYDTYNRDNKVPMLSDPVTDVDTALVADRLRAQDIMASEVVTLPPIAEVGEIIRCLRDTPHQSFPISPGPSKAHAEAFDMIGVISRKALLQLLAHRGQFYHGEEDAEAGGGTRAVSTDEPVLRDWTYNDRLDILSTVRPFSTSAYLDEDPITSAVPEGEFGRQLDLRPFAHLSPMVLPRHASALQAYHIFRHLGCHEIFVTPQTTQTFGIICRKDITLQNGRLALWRKKQRVLQAGSSSDVEDGCASLAGDSPRDGRMHVSIEIRCAENGDGALHKPLRDAERCKSGDADGEDGHPAAKLWDRV